MMSATASRSMTVEEFLALPDEGVDREIINGELRERPTTVRNRVHSELTATLVGLLVAWLRQQSKPHGKALAGEAGFILRREPTTVVGIDVAYLSPEQSTRQREATTTMVEGPPTLAVEVLSPSDTQEEIVEKIRLYLAAGVAVVWIVEPTFRTVTEYRQGATPRMFAIGQTLSAPEMPGFEIAVDEIFEDL